jgi:hypothetical protein
MGSMTALDMLIVRKQFLVNKKGSLFLSFLEEALMGRNLRQGQDLPKCVLSLHLFDVAGHWGEEGTSVGAIS